MWSTSIVLGVFSACLLSTILWSRNFTGTSTQCGMIYSHPLWLRVNVTSSSAASISSSSSSVDAEFMASNSIFSKCLSSGHDAAATRYTLQHFTELDSSEPSRECAARGIVLFIPGSGGDYRQGRSLGAELARAGGCVDLYALDFDGERALTAGARALAAQRDFTLLSLETLGRASPLARITLVGHSYGGVIARAAASAWIDACDDTQTLGGIVTLSTPHDAAPLGVNADTDSFFSLLNRRWRAAGARKNSTLAALPLVSISGGEADGQIVNAATDVERLLGGNSKVWAWASPQRLRAPRGGVEHQTVVWCSELITPLAIALTLIEESALHGSNWTHAVVSALEASVARQPPPPPLSLPASASTSNQFTAGTAAALAQLPLQVINKMLSVAAAVIIGSLVRAIARAVVLQGDVGRSSSSSLDAGGCIRGNILALAIAPAVACISLGDTALHSMGLRANIGRSLLALPPWCLALATVLVVVFNSHTGFMRGLALLPRAMFEAAVSRVGAHALAHSFLIFIVSMIGGLAIAQLLLQIVVPALALVTRAVTLRSSCSGNCARPGSIFIAITFLIIGSIISLVIPWIAIALDQVAAQALAVRFIAVGLVPGLLLFTLVISFSGLAREPDAARASVALGALFIVTALTWAPSFEAALRAVHSQPVDVTADFESVAQELSRAFICAAASIFAANLSTLSPIVIIDDAHDEDEGVSIVTIAARLIAWSSTEAQVSARSSSSSFSSPPAPPSAPIRPDALIFVPAAPPPCACVTRDSNFRGCQDAEATARGGDCWTLLADRVVGAASADAEQRGSGISGARAAFTDAAARAARWARVRLRPGSVLLELPPTARLPRALVPAAAQNRSASSARARPTTAAAAPRPAASFAAVLALPLAVLRPFLCAACACPHLDKGGHISARDLIHARGVAAANASAAASATAANVDDGNSATCDTTTQGWARVDEWFEPDDPEASTGAGRGGGFGGGGVFEKNREPAGLEMILVALIGAVAMSTIRSLLLSARFWMFVPSLKFLFNL